MQSTKLTQFTIDEKQSGAISIDIDLINKFIRKYKNEKVKIVTIIGLERQGKSAFLNCLISTLLNKQCAPFEVKSAIDSRYNAVTTGVDCVYLHEYNLLILDVQGICGLRSEVDPVVMLFIYCISTHIIINTHMMLNTQTLNMLQFMMHKLPEMEKASETNKPKLIFRIYDCPAGTTYMSIIDNYDMMMKPRNDTVKKIRESIAQLFSLPYGKNYTVIPIIAYSFVPATYSLQLIDAGNVQEFLKNEKQYAKSCSELVEILVDDTAHIDLFDILNHANAIMNNNQVEELVTPHQEIANNWIDIEKTIYMIDLDIKSCSQIDEDKINTRRANLDKLYNSFIDAFSGYPESTIIYGVELLKMHLEPFYQRAQFKFTNFMNEYNMSVVYPLVMNIYNNIIVKDSTAPSYWVEDRYREDVLKKFINDRNYSKICLDKLSSLLNELAKWIFEAHKQRYETYIIRYNKTVEKITGTLEIKNIHVLMQPYIDQITVPYSKVMLEIMNRYKEEIDPPSDVFKDGLQWLKNIWQAEKKESECDITIEVNEYKYQLSLNIHDFDIEAVLVSSTQQKKSSKSELTSLLCKFGNAIKDYETEFYELRYKEMPLLLAPINRMPLAEKIDNYKKIKFNGRLHFLLYDVLGDNIYNASTSGRIDLYLFRSIKGNENILTEKEFKENYHPKVQAMYNARVYNSLYASYVSDNIFRVFVDNHLMS